MQIQFKKGRVHNISNALQQIILNLDNAWIYHIIYLNKENPIAAWTMFRYILSMFSTWKITFHAKFFWVAEKAK